MSTSRTAVCAVLAALAAPAAHAQPAAPPPALPKIATWELANGMKVAHLRVERAPVVAVQVWYRAGSAAEPDGKHGVAKMLELLMFRGSAHVRPDDHTDFVQRVGGQIRSSTLEDATGFSDLVPRQYLDLAIRLEADRMRGLEWRPADVDAVRKVVAEELVPRLTGDPTKQAYWRLHELVYGNHGYAREPVGDQLDLEKIQLADVKKFYDAYYVPNNALLVVAGDVSEAEVRAAADKWLAPIARAADPPRLAAPASGTSAQRRELGAGPVGLVFHGWRIPEAKHADVYALQMASLVLGVGRGSRIGAELISTRRMVEDAGASAVLRAHQGLFFAYASFGEPALTKAIEGALAGQVAALAKSPPTAAEMERARNLLLSDFVPRLETATGLANQTGLSWVLTGDPGQFLRDFAALAAVTGADVQRVAAAHLGKDARFTVVLPPEVPR